MRGLAFISEFIDRFWRPLRVSMFVALFAVMTMGFRVFPGGYKWAVNPSSPKLWINFCSRPEFSGNDLPAGDPLAGQSLTFNSVSQSVFDDYNNVSTSYVRLYDEATDPSFGTSNSSNKIINVCFSALFGEGGFSERSLSGDTVVGCTVTLDTQASSSAKEFVRTLTHELGHCLGLDHPQETSHAVMSYFTDAIRLQDDDKAGISYLYPGDPSYANESPTFGFSCSPR